MSAATRDAVLSIARRWIGTPYRHQASREGVGCDCLGLIRGIWRELYGCEPEAAHDYSPNWAEAGNGEALIEAARRHFDALVIAVAEPGDLLLFRMREGRAVKHCGIADEGGRLIHAYGGGAVVATALTTSWRRRCAGAFRFPEPDWSRG